MQGTGAGAGLAILSDDTATSAGNIKFWNSANTFYTNLIPTAGIGANNTLTMPSTTGTLALTAGASIPSLAQYDLLYASAVNTLAALNKVNSAMLVTTSAGVPGYTATMTNGQLVIGSTSGTPTAALPTSTTGLTYTGSAGGLAIDLQGGITGTNLLTNSDFQIFQRSTSATSGTTLGVVSVAASTTAYTIDRWQLSTAASQISSVTQVIGASPGAANGNGFRAQVGRNSGQTGTGTMRFCHTMLIGECRALQGKVLSLSWLMSRGANYSATSNNIVVNVYTGTGATDISGINGAFTGNVTTANTVTIAGTTLVLYTLPAVITMPTGATQIAIEFACTPTGTAGAADNFNISNMKLEVGSVCTPFEEIPYPVQIQKCYYTYYNTFLLGGALGQNKGTNTGEFLFPATALGALTDRSPKFVFPVQMRAAPAITTYNPSATNAQVRDETNSVDTSATATANLTANGFSITCTGNASSTVGAFLGVHFQADIDVV